MWIFFGARPKLVLVAGRRHSGAWLTKEEVP